MWSPATKRVSFILLAFLSLGVNAQISLYIPGVDPQPISADLLGVGSDGRTTWAIQQGTPTGTFTDPQDFGFPGEATLVEDASVAVLSAVFRTLGSELGAFQSCTLNNGLAVCAEVISLGSTVSSNTVTETVSPFLVQGGGPASHSSASPSAPTNPPATSGTQSASGSNQASARPSPTSTGIQATGTTSAKSAADNIRISDGLLGLGLLGSIINMFL